MKSTIEIIHECITTLRDNNLAIFSTKESKEHNLIEINLTTSYGIGIKALSYLNKALEGTDWKAISINSKADLDQYEAEIETDKGSVVHSMIVSTMDDIDSYGFDPFICHTDMVIFVAKE
jgi:coproporphyrinogen III oxidase-like Fe-S oxidoreductase